MTEDRLQQDIFIYHCNTYPCKRGLFFHNFNNPRNAIQGAKLKTLGLVSGVADMTLLHNGKTYFFELKTATGKQSKRQQEWERQVTSEKFNYYIIRTLEEFKEKLKEIYC